MRLHEHQIQVYESNEMDGMNILLKFVCLRIYVLFFPLLSKRTFYSIIKIAFLLLSFFFHFFSWFFSSTEGSFKSAICLFNFLRFKQDWRQFSTIKYTCGAGNGWLLSIYFIWIKMEWKKGSLLSKRETRKWKRKIFVRIHSSS